MPAIPQSLASGVSTGKVAGSRIVVFRDEEIIEKQPVNRALLALTVRLGLRPVPGPKYNWQEGDRFQRTTFVNDASAAFSGTADGSTSTFTVDDGGIFKTQMVILLPSHADEVRCLVTGVSGNDITVSSINPDAALSGTAIADNLEIVIIGTAYAEGAGIPTLMSVQPGDEHNYIQKFKDAWGETDYMESTQLYGPGEIEYQEMHAVDVHMLDMERSGWFGKRKVTSEVTATDYSSDATPTWFADGVDTRLTTNVIYQTGTTPYAASGTNWRYENFKSDLRPQFDEEAGANLLGFISPELLDRVCTADWMDDTGVSGAVHQNRNILEELFGIDIRRAVFPGGGAVWFIPHNEIFRRTTGLVTTPPATTSQMNAKLYVLNMNYIQGHTLAPGKTHPGGVMWMREGVQTDDVDGQKNVVTSYHSVATKNERKHSKHKFSDS